VKKMIGTRDLMEPVPMTYWNESLGSRRLFKKHGLNYVNQEMIVLYGNLSNILNICMDVQRICGTVA